MIAFQPFLNLVTRNTNAQLVIEFANICCYVFIFRFVFQSVLYICFCLLNLLNISFFISVSVDFYFDYNLTEWERENYSCCPFLLRIFWQWQFKLCIYCVERWEYHKGTGLKEKKNFWRMIKTETKKIGLTISWFLLFLFDKFATHDIDDL